MEKTAIQKFEAGKKQTTSLYRTSADDEVLENQVSVPDHHSVRSVVVVEQGMDLGDPWLHVFSTVISEGTTIDRNVLRKSADCARMSRSKHPSCVRF